jgi:HlyD family secretion protein
VVSANVVTYTTVIDVDNPDLKLKPGMTATVSIEVARRDNVLTVPSAALRFKPTATALTALGATPSAPPVSAGTTTRAPEPGAVRATLWRYDGVKLDSQRVAIGLSDGTTTEILGGALAEGDAVVTSVTLASSAARAAAATTTIRSPLAGPMGGPRPR